MTSLFLVLILDVESVVVRVVTYYEKPLSWALRDDSSLRIKTSPDRRKTLFTLAPTDEVLQKRRMGTDHKPPTGFLSVTSQSGKSGRGRKREQEKVVKCSFN